MPRVSSGKGSELVTVVEASRIGPHLSRLFNPAGVSAGQTRAMTTDTMTPATTAQHLDAVLRSLADLLDTIPTDRDAAPTPCTDFTVAALRQHVIGWLTAFTDGYSSLTGQCSDAEQVTVAGTGGDQVRGAADRLSTALPEATARPLRIGESEMPGDMALQMILWEYQTHGWDLAAAAGQSWQPDEAGVAASLQFAPAMLTPDFQGEGKPFGPPVPVPADAPALHRLLGLSGRDPRWSVQNR